MFCRTTCTVKITSRKVGRSVWRTIRKPRRCREATSGLKAGSGGNNLSDPPTRPATERPWRSLGPNPLAGVHGSHQVRGNRGTGKRTHQVQWSDCVGYGHFNVLTPMGLVLSEGLVSLGLVAPTSEPLLNGCGLRGGSEERDAATPKRQREGGAVETDAAG